MTLSKFGDRFAQDSGIVSLMEDLGDALNVNPDLLFLGGGNPAKVPAFEDLIAHRLREIANDQHALSKLIGIYQSPQGSESFISALTHYLNDHYGWAIDEQNVAITNGSQSAFFMLINMLAGTTADEKTKKNILFPMMPEYLGYADQGIDGVGMVGCMPEIEERGEHRFKYHVDFDRLPLDDNTAAICVSRPTNPTGNVLTENEMATLTALAKRHNIPLIVDCAYGQPFPGIIYQRAHSVWQPGTIFVLSLSKLGLPGARTGIVIADPSIVNQLAKMNTIMSLASGNLGPSLVSPMLLSGELKSLCEKTLLPFYQQKRDFAVSCVERYFSGLPYSLHEPEGAFFIWLWFKGLPITTVELYQRLKQKGVLIMAGEHFFFGVESDDKHQKECIRLTYCQSEEVVEQALKLISDEIKHLFKAK